jgi:hypothetical protein
MLMDIQYFFAQQEMIMRLRMFIAGLSGLDPEAIELPEKEKMELRDKV